MNSGKSILAAALILSGAFTQSDTIAQQAGIKRTNVVRQNLDTGGREAIQVRVDFAPGVTFGRHSHPGTEIAYVLEGKLEYRLDGEPAVTLGPGEALFIPAGKIHSASNAGTTNAAELATYIVEKGKPLVVLAK